MKNSFLFLFLFIIFISSCSNKNEQKLLQENEILEEEIDSLTALVPSGNDVGLKFVMLLEKETQTASDSTLIPQYKSLLGHNEIIDIYIWDRIETLSNFLNHEQIVKEFTGMYRLKPIHNDKYSTINSIKIKNDSLFLLKNQILIVSDKIKIRNSSNNFTKGKLMMGNYRLSLNSSGFGKLIFVNDNNCMDCEQLEFYKTN